MHIRRKFVRSVYEMVSVLVTSVITIMLIFTFIFRIAGVIGPSMQPTLSDGDKLIVTAFNKKPAIGDIIIITQPNPFNEPLVKRIIALEGQTVDIDFLKGIVTVDGKPESYGYGLTTDEFDVDFPLKVEKGCVFVLGDNRHHSTDSRSTTVGQIDMDYILGKVVFRFMPAGSWRVK